MDSQNKSQKLDLALEKFWVTQYGCIRLCTTVAMGMKITNCLKLFHYGVKRDHYNNFIGMSELLERHAMDFFSNIFTTDTRTPSKKIPSLDVIYDEGTVSTCRSFNYFSYPPQNSEISTISEITITTDTTTDIRHTASKEVEN